MTKSVIEPFYKKLGARIRRHREANGISQATLGRALKPKVTRACIANMEAGNQRVLAHTLAKLADVLAVDLEDLLF